MEYLKQSTAITIKLGPFLDETNGRTAETALTISQADIRISKNGGAFAQTNNAAGATHDENGWYGVPLNTTDTATLGRLKIAIHESGALPCFAEFMVVTANVYDSLCSTDKLEVDLKQILGTALTETAGYIAAGFKKLFNVATPLLVASDVMRGTDSAATEAKQDIIDTNIDQIETAVITNAAGVDIAADIIALKAETVLIVADTNELQTDDIPGTLATIAGYIDTEIGTIITAVGTTIPDAIAALPTDADVNAACDSAISDAALATAAILKEVNQSLNGAKCVVDRAASTFKVYDTDGTTLMFTITKATIGNVDTLTRT